MAVWPHRFKLVLTVVLKVNSLSQQLQVHNTGDASFRFTTLLHTYFKVDHLDTTRVSANTLHARLPPHTVASTSLPFSPPSVLSATASA